MAKTGIAINIPDGTPVEIFTHEDGGCTSFQVQCLESSAAWVEIRIPNLHGDSWFPVRQNRDVIFRVNHGQAGGITQVFARGGDGGSADIDWGPVANTDRNDER